MKNTVSLKMNYEFKRLYAKGRSCVTPCVVVYCRKNRGGSNRLGLTVRTKVGKAVVRNRVRRRLREIYRLNEQRLRSGFDIVIVARVRAVNVSYRELEAAVMKAFRSLDLLQSGEEQ
ncbi:MAG: ribonuclease P protein component [Oscillospiraceae bacterium]|nr:ribonuclease P protein component [Oscillospiraceae bacterium]